MFGYYSNEKKTPVPSDILEFIRDDGTRYYFDPTKERLGHTEDNRTNEEKIMDKLDRLTRIVEEQSEKIDELEKQIEESRRSIERKVAVYGV